MAAPYRGRRQDDDYTGGSPDFQENQQTYGAPQTPSANTGFSGGLPQVAAQTGGQLTGGSVPNGDQGQAQTNAQGALNATGVHFDRNGFRDAWMGSTGSMSDFLAQHPEYGGLTALNEKNGTYQLPSGEIMDLQIAKGAMGDNALHGWTGVGQVGAGGQPIFYNQQPGQGNVAGTINGSNGGGGDLAGSYRQHILSALDRYSNPTSLDDPSIKPQMDATRVATARGLEATRKANAERAYAEGRLNSNGFDQEQQQAQERSAADQAQTEAGIVDTAEGRRMGILSQLLGMGGGYLNAQDQRALEDKLSGQRLGFDYANLGQQKELEGGRLGFNYAQLQQQANRDAIIAALGGI